MGSRKWIYLVHVRFLVIADKPEPCGEIANLVLEELRAGFRTKYSIKPIAVAESNYIGDVEGWV